HTGRATPKGYDVFVSYRHHEPEATWVRGTLVRRLRQAGLTVCLDVDSFTLGSILVAEMARAVESSRFTVAVLTPAYLVSTFTELETILAEHLEAQQRERRLLVVLRAPCEPREGIRARAWLDMTTDDEIERNFPRLVATVKQTT